MASAQHKSFKAAAETRRFEKGILELLNLGSGTVGRLTLQPGWKWSQHVKPLVGTQWCEAPHFQYHVSGVLHVLMEDGSEFDIQPGEISLLPSGHDAWVVGDEPVVVIDWAGATHYAEKNV